MNLKTILRWSPEAITRREVVVEVLQHTATGTHGCPTRAGAGARPTVAAYGEMDGNTSADHRPAARTVGRTVHAAGVMRVDDKELWDGVSAISVSNHAATI